MLSGMTSFPTNQHLNRELMSCDGLFFFSISFQFDSVCETCNMNENLRDKISIKIMFQNLLLIEGAEVNHYNSTNPVEDRLPCYTRVSAIFIMKEGNLVL